MARIATAAMDTLSPEQRSARMKLIRSADTKPELAVRRALHGVGYRFRLHDKRLPGRPDLVFRRRRKVVFVHGCFWHQHVGCPACHVPKSRRDYWATKLERNMARDRERQAALEADGWSVMVVWECEARHVELILPSLRDFLGPARLD